MKEKWSYFTFRDKVILLIILQLLILIGTPAFYYSSFLTGSRVFLQTEPIGLIKDNHIEYKLKELTADFSKWEGKTRPKIGDEVYVKFQKTNQIHKLVSITPEKPSVQKGETLLKAKIKQSYDKIILSFGSNRYYFSEKEKEKILFNKSYVIEIKQNAFGTIRNISITEIPDLTSPKQLSNFEGK